ncbi:hypothetical protein CBL_10425 [Carabus blaptoides fortunei]
MAQTWLNAVRDKAEWNNTYVISYTHWYVFIPYTIENGNGNGEGDKPYRNFDVILERVEVSKVNAEILHVVEGVRKYNRTCKAYSSNFTLFKDLDYGVSGAYYLKDFVPDGADFPAVANFPWKSVMTRLRIFYDQAILVIIKMYLTFDHDAELKRLG